MILALEGLRLGNQEFEVHSGYIGRPSHTHTEYLRL